MTADLAAAPIRRDAWLSARAVFDLGAGALARAVASGAITPAQFEAGMRELVEDLHVAAYAAGRSGDWEAIRPEEWRRVERVLEQQFAFLRGFRDAVRDAPEADRSEAQITQRSRLYGAASRQSFVRAELAAVGLTCELPAYPGDGTTDCLVNCVCAWSVRTLSKGRGDYDVSWRLGAAEHCRQCRKRARVWKGLKVRGNVLVSGYETLGTFK